MLETFSTPSKVYQKARKIYGNAIEIKPSTRKNKKYMIYDGAKWIHFGQMGYEDYTKHNDPKRREAFRIRNKKWAKENKYSPAFLSFHLLW